MVGKRRFFMGLEAAAVFGIGAGLFKGNGSALRAGIGNLSGPWALVALVPALSTRTVRNGSVTGMACTGVALLGFYVALTSVLAGQLGGGGFVREFVVEVEANRIYFLAGAITGPLLGAVGAWIGLHRPRSAGLVVGGLLAGEIFVVALIKDRQLLPTPFYFAWTVQDWTPYLAELAIGVVVAIEGIRYYRDARTADE